MLEPGIKPRSPVQGATMLANGAHLPQLCICSVLWHVNIYYRDQHVELLCKWERMCLGRVLDATRDTRVTAYTVVIPGYFNP